MDCRWTGRRFKIEWYCPWIPHRASRITYDFELAKNGPFPSRINHTRKFLDIREVNSKWRISNFIPKKCKIFDGLLNQKFWFPITTLLTYCVGFDYRGRLFKNSQFYCQRNVWAFQNFSTVQIFGVKSKDHSFFSEVRRFSAFWAQI